MSSRSNYRGSTLSNNSRQDMNRSRSSHRNSNEYKSQKRTTSYDRSYSSRNNRRTFEENNRKLNPDELMAVIGKIHKDLLINRNNIDPTSN